jgi:hypothetical protein
MKIIPGGFTIFVSTFFVLALLVLAGAHPASAALTINGVQGYDPSKQCPDGTSSCRYTTGTAESGTYLVLYGTFSDASITVTLKDYAGNAKTLDVSYTSTSQINAKLPDGLAGGTYSVFISGSSGNSNEFSFTIGTLSANDLEILSANDLQITSNNAMKRDFTLKLAKAINDSGYTAIIEDRVLVSPVDSSWPGGAVHVPFVWYVIKIAQMPDWPGEEINVNQAMGNPDPAAYAAHIVATAPSESWCSGIKPDYSETFPCIGVGCVMTTADGGIYPGSTPIASGSGDLTKFFQYLNYLPAEKAYSDMVKEFHNLYDDWHPGMPFPNAPPNTPPRSMNAQEIDQFKKDNPDYVNPYLIFTAGGVFGDPSTWTYQQHKWYDPTYTSHTGQQCPGSYCWGVAEARRNPFTDYLSSCTVSSPYGRIDSKGEFYWVFGADPSMGPYDLSDRLMNAAYNPDTAKLTGTMAGGLTYWNALRAYARKAVDAYISPKLPAFVAQPAPLSNGYHGPEETKIYSDAQNAYQAYLKAATKAVVSAVQQIQLQMGSASDEGAAARQFISQWNKDTLPTPPAGTCNANNCPTGQTCTNGQCVASGTTPKYKCSGTSCVQDANGQYTTSNCNNACTGVTYTCTAGGIYVGCLSPSTNNLLVQDTTKTCPAGQTCYKCVSGYSPSGSTCVQTGTCKPVWQCTAWSPATCTAGQTQTRTCTDSNGCGTTSDKPATSQACAVTGGGSSYTGTCSGHCGARGEGNCWCDTACLNHNDCCPDYNSLCVAESGAIAPKLTCSGFCGSRNPAGCWCDDVCQTWGDCCADHEQFCGTGASVTGTPACGNGVCGAGETCSSCAADCGQCGTGGTNVIGSNVAQGGSKSCQGKCGKKADGCWCDYACKNYGDCCADLEQSCGSSPPTAGSQSVNNTCAGMCGYKTQTGCWCDSDCAKYNDCCQDYSQICANP